MTTSATVSTGFRVLIVEDDYFIADDMRRAFAAAGVDVVGPVPTVEAALDLLNGPPAIGGAVLDINLDGDLVFPVADALVSRGIPFVFTTGYDGRVVPETYALVKRFEKPCDPARVLQALSAAR